ncbi:putative holo-[acyl-carrier-protein] synthase [[Candida] railenensis]|uniref:Holo-[acyl-carrier-protein] synthase n=1 Tax=[Candida] railenensis TaxID=45579 RepID=A0A9P0QSQ0_9ASCO|nr:putative holo-[acyl-carrier-protein] synthase [[Candida] railenensis]
MTVLGIGVDIVKISRFNSLLAKDGGKNGKTGTSRFIRRVLHPKELMEFEELRQNDSIEPRVRYVAGSWAAKEAIFKTLDPKDQKIFQFKDWYRYKDSFGKPHIWNDDYNEREQFLLSISHDGDTLIANVLRQVSANALKQISPAKVEEK